MPGATNGRQHDRVIAAEVLRTVIALSVVASTTSLGLNGVIDAAAVTGILGAVVGIAGAQGAAAVGGRAAKAQGDETHTERDEVP